MENVKKFYEALANDETLRGKFETLNEKYKDIKELSPETVDRIIVECIVPMAKEAGFNFTADEYKAYGNAPREMNEDELESVAGGAYDFWDCVCFMGGGGLDYKTGKNCICVVGGGGVEDEWDNYLVCVLWGCTKKQVCVCDKERQLEELRQRGLIK